MFALIKVLKTKIKEVEGVKSMNFYIKRIRNVENDWGHNVQGDAVEEVEDALDCGSRDGVVLAISKIKTK